ncbi:MAG: hypothetical protein ACHQF4_11675 [Sphingobacteriales bacterium]
MKTIFSIVLISCWALLQGCHVGTSGTWRNGRISLEVKQKIDALNKKLFEAIVTKDPTKLKQLMSPPLLEKSGSNLDTIITSFNNKFNATSYDVLDDYYTKNSTTNISNTVFPNRGDSNDYKIQYLALNQEMYVSLLISKNLPVNFIILAIYGKYDNGWKLNILQLGEYSILNKTAPEYYNESRNQYNKGNLIDAADLIITASEIAHPVNEYLTYQNDDEMKTFYAKALKDANAKYQFPITVNKVKTNPQVFGVSPQLIVNGNDEGIFPMVKYKSGIELGDTVALKVENNAIQKVIGNIFKGINNGKGYIIYQAFNQIPDGKTLVKQYGFIQKLGKH